MDEDTIYRSTTQFQHWSFSPESLASLRERTNKAAVDRAPEGVECLSIAEELKLVQYYSGQCLRVGGQFKFPTAVKATAVQYMKRFYLSNSTMTYHPKSIFKMCLFMATKTENSYISLENFASKLKTTMDDVIAPEFILTQGLRFTYDVQHPNRGLRGGLIELLAMARGEAALLPGLSKSAKQVQDDMMALPMPKSQGANGGAPTSPKSTKELETRCGIAHDHAKELLGEAAVLTDAYLLYTPAQIWLAAFLLSDEPLGMYYLSTKFPDKDASNSIYDRVITTLRMAGQLLSSYSSVFEPREELVRIDKKLYECQNSDKKDLVGLNKAQKRNGGATEAESEEKRAKKRKLEREKLEADGEMFGGPLEKNQVK